MNSFPSYRQLDQVDCGPTCLRNIAKHYGKDFTLQFLRSACSVDRQGVSLQGIGQAAETIGMRTKSYRLTLEDLQTVKMPCIAHWNQNHFVVIYKISKDEVWISDPSLGLVEYPIGEFEEHWISTIKGELQQGVIMEVAPGADFYEKEKVKGKTGFHFLFSYLRPYRGLIIQLIIGMLVGSLIQLAFPFLTQAVVDLGIKNKDISFIYLLLMGQFLLFAGQETVEIIRNWILLHIGARVNISLVSDFLMKLLRLPISFFDSKLMGDLLQRVNDHSRIEHFLTASSLNALFSLFNVVVFGIVLLLYSKLIFFVFALATLLYFLWIAFFLKRRKELDEKKFEELSKNRSQLIQLLSGIQDIKLSNSESQMRWDWEQIQTSLFKVTSKSLGLDQFQRIGAQIINHSKNILIVFLAAKGVVDGEMTLGMMMAVQFIAGQLNSPIDQLLGFVKDAQDAKLSLERIRSIHDHDSEEDLNKAKIDILPEDGDISTRNLNFRYGEEENPMVLSNVNVRFAFGQTTALVGASGSGKTTLLKLLAKIYTPVSGEILFDNANIKNIRNATWRNRVGLVTQDGFIFSDTIAKNIALGTDIIDHKRLLETVELVNLREEIESFPLSYNTKIGPEGIGLSEGQKQRILLARTLYKNPDYLLLDESTNALDAQNEKIIEENLNTHLKGKTVIRVASRISTIKNADQIIVLDKGVVIEKGTHTELSNMRGIYYNLVKHQADLSK
jgi:ATP-binding cassette subfamily B protein